MTNLIGKSCVMVGIVVCTFAMQLGCGNGADAGPSGGSGGAGGSTGGSAGAAGISTTAGTGGSTAGSVGTGGDDDGVDGCRPMLVQPDDNPQTVTLITQAVAPGAGATRITSVRSHGDAIVYSTSAGIYRLPKAGGAPTTVSMTEGVNRLFLAGDTLYWLAGTELRSVSASAADAMPTKVMDTPLQVGSDYLFAVDATNAYVWLRPTRAIQALSLATGMATTLLEEEKSTSWILVDGFIYFAGDYDLMKRVAVTGGMPERLHQGHNILWAPGVDGTQLYYGGSNILVKIDGMNEQYLMQGSMGFIERIVPQGDLLLWEGWQGAVGFVSKDGSRCGTVIDSLFGFAGWDHDETSFYLATEDAIYQVPY